MRRLLLPLLLSVPLLAAAPRCRVPVRLIVVPPAVRVAAFERFETRGWVVADFDNPFDPHQVELTGEFVDPDGVPHSMPGFYTRSFERRLVEGREELEPVGVPFFAVRFVPTRPGRWCWRWRVRTPAGSDATPCRPFRVAPAPPERHGFLRVSPDDPRYLRFDDGTAFVAVGENLAWYDARGSHAYDDWLAKLAAQGVNTVRLWMPSWAFGLEWLARDADGAITRTDLGDYRGRLERAWQLDTVFERLEELGIHAILCIQNHGPFSLTANSEWHDNPYNAANGGPLDTPEAVFDDPEARELFRRRLRYLVARYGASTRLLAFELWNEVDLVAGHSARPVVEWHAEMAQQLRDLDPYDHLISTSLSQALGSPLFALPQIDFTQVHFYSFPFNFDFSEVLPFLVEQARVPGKPTLLGEYGVDWRGPAETRERDPQAIGFHDGLWAPLLSGAFGTGLSWWWDNLIDPDDLYFHFGPVSRFVSGIAFDREGFVAGQLPAAAPDRNLVALALRGSDVVLVWLKNRDHQWAEVNGGPDLRPVSGAALTVTALGPGEWQARWIDTYTGEDVGLETVAATGADRVLEVPSFARDIALRLERR